MRHMNYNIVLFIAFLFLTACGSKDSKNTISESEGATTTDDRIYVTKAQFEHNKMTLGALEDKEFPNLVKTFL